MLGQSSSSVLRLLALPPPLFLPVLAHSVFVYVVVFVASRDSETEITLQPATPRPDSLYVATLPVSPHHYPLSAVPGFLYHYPISK